MCGPDQRTRAILFWQFVVLILQPNNWQVISISVKGKALWNNVPWKVSRWSRECKNYTHSWPQFNFASAYIIHHARRQGLTVPPAHTACTFIHYTCIKSQMIVTNSWSLRYMAAVISQTWHFRSFLNCQYLCISTDRVVKCLKLMGFPEIWLLFCVHYAATPRCNSEIFFEVSCY